MTQITYRAEITTQHLSEHRSLNAAIRALRRAERQTGLHGGVTEIIISGSHRSTQQVYPTDGRAYSTFV